MYENSNWVNNIISQPFILGPLIIVLRIHLMLWLISTVRDYLMFKLHSTLYLPTSLRFFWVCQGLILYIFSACGQFFYSLKYMFSSSCSQCCIFLNWVFSLSISLSSLFGFFFLQVFDNEFSQWTLSCGHSKVGVAFQKYVFLECFHSLYITQRAPP